MSTPPILVDQIIEARWIIPVEPDDTTLEHHSLVIQGERILDLLPTEQARQRYTARETTVLGEHILMPGLVNLHCHAAMTLLRGLADDLPLMRWLQEAIWPTEARHVGHAFVHDGSLLAAAEMLKGGITTCNDMYFYPDATAQAFARVGLRSVLGITVIDFPSGYGQNAEEYIAKGLAAREAWGQHPLIRFAIAPHAPYTVSDQNFERLGQLAEDLDLPIHVHLYETAQEVANSLRDHGQRPIARLDALGLLSPRLIAVHAVHLDETDRSTLAARGCSVAHCPTSNMKLASGAAPVADLVARGIPVGLGSDGAASNNRLDLLREMQQASLLAKLTTGDAAALPAHQILRMATLEGARALGMDADIGSLVPGKLADLCAVKLDAPETQPCYHPISHLVHVLGREAVSNVWVSGKRCLTQGKLLQITNTELLSVAQLWQNKIHL